MALEIAVITDASAIMLGDIISFLKPGPVTVDEANSLPRVTVTGVMPVSGQARRRSTRGTVDQYSVYYKPVTGGELANRRLAWNAKVLKWHVAE
jgi:hypothetical protein